MKVGLIFTGVILATLVTIDHVRGTSPPKNGIAQKSISGVYSEEFPLPIYYDTFAPIILEYILPHWNKSDVTFNNWYNCTSETAPYRYTCPSVYHMNKAVLNLHIDFLAIQPVTDTIRHASYYESLIGHSSFCTLVQRHFSGIYIQNDELESYLLALEECGKVAIGDDSAIMVLERGIPDFNFSIRHPFTRMESNFYNIFYKSITGSQNGSLDLVASATLSNARSSIQGTLLSAYYAEKYRWSHAVQDCNAGIIPHSLLGNSKFAEKLEELSQLKKFAQNYELSIPTSSISRYFRLPITDCTYTNDTFLVRIQVPLLTKSKLSQVDIDLNPGPIPKLVSVSPAPFLYQNRICMVSEDSHQRYIYDSTNMVAYTTECKSNEICNLEQNLSQQFIDPCVTALLNQNFQQVTHYCNFACLPHFLPNVAGVDEERGLVTRVGSDKYILTGQAATVNCPPADVSHIPEELEGAIEVTLSCNCYLEVNGRKYIPSPSGCGSEVFINRILPWHLIKDKNREANELSLDGDLLQTYLNGLDAPSMFEKNTNSGYSKLDDLVNKAQGRIEDASIPSLLPIWIVFGMFCTCLLLIQIYIIYTIRQPHNGNYRLHPFFFKARTPEPQVSLLEPGNGPGYDL